mgnify:CR=1 FL=1
MLYLEFYVRGISDFLNTGIVRVNVHATACNVMCVVRVQVLRSPPSSALAGAAIPSVKPIAAIPLKVFSAVFFSAMKFSLSMFQKQNFSRGTIFVTAGKYSTENELYLVLATG